MALGIAPRHSVLIGLGPLRIARMVKRRVVVWDCWTRVLRRSAGWRTTADTEPPMRPEVKCLRLFASADFVKEGRRSSS